MKLIHLSDLHLGKRLNEFPLLEDQEEILIQILGILDEEKPDGLILAGDVYDKPVPSAEAVELFDRFLVQLAQQNLQVFIISGNHDSPERLAFGGRLMDDSGVHFSPVYKGEIHPIRLSDEWGVVAVWMLPFVKPVHVRRFFPEEEIGSYTDALRVAIGQMKRDPTERNVLITHQFVTGAERSESEEISVGGTDNVDVSVFEGFDYVALGHLHRPQWVGSEHIRYCGTPLKYSFSEAKDHKSVSVVEIGAPGEVSVRTVPLIPKREMTELRGSYEALTLKSFYEGTSYRDDYVRVILTDETDIPDAFAKLRVIYRNLMKLEYDNRRTRNSGFAAEAADVEAKSPLQLFAEFYAQQNGSELTDEQSEFLRTKIERIWEGEA